LPLSNDAAFVRTDYQPESIVYDAQHKVLFASEGGGVDIIDPYARTIIQSIPVRSVRGMDISPDGSQIVVGSNAGFLTFIDVASRTVARVAKLPMYLPCTNCGEQVVSFGHLVFTNDGDVIGFTEYAYYATGLFRWSHLTGQITAIRSSTLYSGPAQTPLRIFRSYDGKKILVTSNSGFSVGDTIYAYSNAIYDAPTGTFTAGSVNYIAAAAPHASKYEFAEATGRGITFADVDLHTLRTVDFGVYVPLSILYSQDGTKLFGTDRHTFITLDLASNTLLGRAPRFPENVFYIDPDGRDYLPKPMAIDEHNVLFSSANGGIALEYPSSYYSVDPTWQTGYNMALDPAFGPLNSYVATKLWQGISSSSSQQSAWIGNKQAVLGSNSVTAPPSPTSGPEDFKLIFNNGQFAYFPSAFVYGASIADSQPRFGPASGGIPITIVGHGLANVVRAVTVTIGGNTAPVIANSIIDTQPFSTLRALTVTLPAGNAGSGPLDITISTDHGSATLTGAFSYLAEASNYSSGATVNSIVYDRLRNRVYMGATDHVEVFSVSAREYLSPIRMPSLSGARSTDSISLTPDQAQLLVTNMADSSVAIIDLADSTKSTAVGVAVPANSTNCKIYGIAATNRKTALFNLGPSWGCASSPADLLRQLDLASLQVSQETGTSLAINCLNQGAPIFAGSDDGSRVAFGTNGTLCLWESASDSIKVGGLFGSSGGLTLSYDGSFLLSSDRVGDSDLTFLGELGMPWYFGDAGVQGGKMSRGGSLYYMPRPSAIDIFDMNHGWFISRIGIAATIPSANYGSVAFDDKGLIFVLTPSGLSVIRHTIPVSVVRVSRELSTAVPGDVMTLYGDGFTPGTTVRAGGALVTAVFVDGNTLQFRWPEGTTNRQLTVLTPDGQSYTY
jgi:hypothetical protein